MGSLKHLSEFERGKIELMWKQVEEILFKPLIEN